MINGTTKFFAGGELNFLSPFFRGVHITGE